MAINESYSKDVNISELRCGVCYSESDDFMFSPIFVVQKYRLFATEKELEDFLLEISDDETIGDVFSFKITRKEK